MAEPSKILAIQFKYFGDAVVMTPALRAIREHFPKSELHVLVPEEIIPLLQHLPWLNRLWPMPRQRGSASLTQTWPVIRALRRERFDRSVDFGGNDRGAISSLLIRARLRLGTDEGRGFWGRRFCYNQCVPAAPATRHESARLAQMLSGWGIVPSSLEPEIRADPALDAAAERLLPAGTVVCHIASSQTKKEWPVAHWAAFYQLAAEAGWHLAFTTARGAREQSLMDELKRAAPHAPILPVITDLALFLAVLRRAEAFISGDTGPLHFAAGLGVPTIGLFGPSSAAQWAPLGKRHHVLNGSQCSCDGDSAVCYSANHCMLAISPGQLFAVLQTLLKPG
jgi:ADP-heptose:LPS heptosyltransferase